VGNGLRRSRSYHLPGIVHGSRGFALSDRPYTSSGRSVIRCRTSGTDRDHRPIAPGAEGGSGRPPYRPGGWTVRQLVHHIADSHLNAIIRFKLALTEQEPSIKPYDEGAWAKLPDTTNTPPEVSLTLIEALHHRWTVLLRSMGSEDYRRTLFHPEHRRSFSLDEMLVTYSWHSAHHLRHITALAEREGW
jgi:hypothetical protein